jgi:hypothetical protein
MSTIKRARYGLFFITDGLFVEVKRETQENADNLTINIPHNKHKYFDYIKEAAPQASTSLMTTGMHSKIEPYKLPPWLACVFHQCTHAFLMIALVMPCLCCWSSCKLVLLYEALGRSPVVCYPFSVRLPPINHS